MHLVSELHPGEPYADLTPGKLLKAFGGNCAGFKGDRAQRRGSEHDCQAFHGDFQSREGQRFTTSSRKTSCTSCIRTCRSVRRNSSCTLLAAHYRLCSLIEPGRQRRTNNSRSASASLARSFS